MHLYIFTMVVCIINVRNDCCFYPAPFLDLLGLYRKTNASLCVLLSHAWSHITGIPGPSSETDSSSLSPYQWKVPLLLRDLVAQLLQFWLALPPATQIGQ
jgi:hypothetical protein